MSDPKSSAGGRDEGKPIERPQKLLSDLKTVKTNGKPNLDGFLMNTEKQVSDITRKVQTGITSSLDTCIAEFGVPPDGSGELLSNTDGISASELLESASGGLALMGVLVTDNVKDITERRKNVLEMPADLSLKGPISQQINDVVEFQSQSQTDNFNKLFDTIGLSAATSAEVEGLQFRLGVRASEESTKDKSNESASHEDDVCIFRVKYLYLPTATCEIDPEKLRLSQSVLTQLKNMEAAIFPDDEALASGKCKTFLQKYGSHVITGLVEFGGVYKWHATYKSQTSRSKENASHIVRDELNGYVGISMYSGIPGMISSNAAGSAEGTAAHTLHNAVRRVDDETCLEFRMTKKGGPQEDVCISKWKEGLLKYNSTWSVIDRGSSVENDFVGIWDIIRNSHLDEFKDGNKLADTLQQTWQSICGMPPDQVTNVKATSAVGSLNKVIDEIMEWICDEPFPEKACQFLHSLLDKVDNCCTETGNVRVWVAKLRYDKSLLAFLNEVMKRKDDFSSSDLVNVKYNLRKLMEVTEDYNISIRDNIYSFIELKGKVEDHSDIVNKINGVESLITVIEETILDRSLEAPICGIPEDKVNRETARDITIAVNCLESRSKAVDNKHEIFLLLTELSILGFNSEKNQFETCITLHGLRSFTQSIRKHWDEFLKYKNHGLMVLQAFLVQFLVCSKTLTEDPLEKENIFQRLIKVLKPHLTVEVGTVVEKYTSSSPYNWERLKEDLDMLKCGQIPNCSAKSLGQLEGILKSVAQGTGIEIQDTRDSKDSVDVDGLKILGELGLTNYFPSKISLQDVMTIKNQGRKDEVTSSDLPWYILQRLIMLDSKGREGPSKNQDSMSEDQDVNTEDDFLNDDFMKDIASEVGDEGTLNPLDVFVATFACCDMVLKQILAQKMFLCRLAIPLISPGLSCGTLTYSLWALRSIIIECNSNSQERPDTSAVQLPTKSVSFIRLGRPACSKSNLMNNVISDTGHHTFWNRESPHGQTQYHLAKGLVEAQWYLPSGRDDDTFQDVTMFLNLRGDACDITKQMEILPKISNIIVCSLDISDLQNSDVRDTMKMVHESSAKVVLLLTRKEPHSIDVKKEVSEYFNYVGASYREKTKLMSGFKGNNQKTTEELKNQVRKVLQNCLIGQETKAIEDSSIVAKEAGINIDEDDIHCAKAKELAIDVMSCMEGESLSACKGKMLPLQGQHWEELTKQLRAKKTAGGKWMKTSTVYEIDRIEQQMKLLREKQFDTCTHNLSPLMVRFLSNLFKVLDTPAGVLYMQWLKIYLDKISRETLPELNRKYREKWKAFKVHRAEAKNVAFFKKDLEDMGNVLSGVNLGVEHLLREVAQIYESAIESEVELTEETEEVVNELPKAAAKLLLKGHPIEVMDGDVSNVPLTWMKAVFTALTELQGDKRLFVISVLGIQSSGKSTLLNTMFGLQFAVSAGRCTRGVYMQLLKVDRQSSHLPYDYVLVIDTEGLRAPELSGLKHDNDNQLATFVIGLADVTILNIKGENVAEMSDVLQIAVHAFLRMKISSSYQMHRSCILIHQNVSAVNAKAKMQQDCITLEEKLDQMTMEASQIENRIDINSFKDIIDFDSEDNVFHFPDLWHGNPPMAPVNPGYTSHVQEVTEFLLNNLTKKQQNLLTFMDMNLRIDDLWNGVLSENFVFSFRNSLAAKTYNALEERYQKLKHDFDERVTSWVEQVASPQMKSCSSRAKLEEICKQLQQDLTITGNILKAKACSALEAYFEDQNTKSILIEWKAGKVGCLRNDTESFLSRCSKRITDMMESTRDHLHHKKKLADITAEIMRKANDLANESKGEKADEEKLQESFERFWITSVADLAGGDTSKSVKIKGTVETKLYNILEKDSLHLTKQLAENPFETLPSFDLLENSMDVNDILETDLSVSQSYWKRVKGDQHKDHMVDMRREGAEVINKTLQRIDVYLSKIKSKDTDFQEIYATNVIKCIIDDVQQHNTKDAEQHAFTLLPCLVVKVAIHVCRYAVPLFKAMQEKYEQNHSLRAQLEARKQAIWSLFKNRVNQSTNEVIVADLLTFQMETFVFEAVRGNVSLDIVNHMVESFNRQKCKLLSNVLQNLASLHEFEKYQKYVQNPKQFCLDWITTYTAKEIFTLKKEQDRSIVSKYAKIRVDAFSMDIKNSINKATELIEAAKGSKKDIKSWLKYFQSSIRRTLPVDDESLRHLMDQNVVDFKNLQKLLIERLPILEMKIRTYWKDVQPEEVQWVGVRPYKQILDQLWGCEAQCPLCGEPCKDSDSNHKVGHECMQHRPLLFSGLKRRKHFGIFKAGKHGRLSLELCNVSVQHKKVTFTCSSCKYACRQAKSRKCSSGVEVHHPCTDYKAFFPDWNIATSANIGGSKYWIWVATQYQNDLESMYKGKFPDIPSGWNSIRKKAAIESLDRTEPTKHLSGKLYRHRTHLVLESTV